MDLTLKDIPSYLDQIHTFLLKNAKSYVFPSLTMAMEDILVNIARDPNFLKKFDDGNCKNIARQILKVLEENKQIYTLSFRFENYEHWKRVMVYKKIPVPVPLFNEPLGLKQLRKPHSIISQPVPPDDNTNNNTVMSSFKAKCLNATLKFVKDDKQLVLQYPDVSTEQAEFIKHMISQCLSPKDSSMTPGGRSIFEPLAEALKIYSTKYDFKLNNAVPVKIDMKRLFFEKTPKIKKKDWWQIPKKIDERDNDIISISSTSSEEGPDSHHNFAQLLKSLEYTFIRNTIFDIEEFLIQDDEKIEFKNMTIPEQRFLMQWNSVLIASEIIGLFNEEVQDALMNIRSLLVKCTGVCKIRRTVQKVSPKLSHVLLIKKWKRCYDPKVLLQLPDYAKLVKPTSPKVKSEFDMRCTPTYSIPTIKATENSFPNRIVTSESDVLKSNPVAKVTNKMTDVSDKNKIENVFIYDNAPANTMPTIELKSETSVKVKTDNMKVNKDINLNTIPVTKVNTDINEPLSTCPEISKTKLKRTLFSSSDNVIPSIDGTLEVTPEMNATVNSLAKENATANSLTDKANAEICELDDDDFIVNRNPSPVNYQNNTTLSNKQKDIIALRTLLAKADESLIENVIIKLKNFILSTEETLHFSKLTKDEQDVLLSWEDLVNSNEIRCMFCVRGRLLLEEIRRLLEKAKGYFSIDISSKTYMVINRTVVFKRTIYKKSALDDKTATDKDHTDLLNQHVLKSHSIISTTNSQQAIKLDKRIERFIQKTNGLSDEWIICSLQHLKSFLMDDARASMDILNLSHPQAAFLTKWQNILALEEVMITYSCDIQSLLMDVHKCMAGKKSQFSISSNTTNVKKDQTRDVKFIKTPSYHNSSKQNPEKTAPKAKKSKVKKAAKPRATVTEIASNVFEVTKRPKCVTSLAARKVPVLSERGRLKSASFNPKLPHAKAKLIEGLSQPLVSERGLKMMRNMGWDGGALGLRGEGIVEPIALPLDLKRGAGLGSEKRREEPLSLPTAPAMTNLPFNITRVVLPHNPGKKELRTGFLQTILNMVEAEQPATELNFPKKLTLGNWAFLKQYVITVNKRVVYKPDVPALVELSSRIVEALSKSHFTVTACWGVSKMNVLFLLLKNSEQPLELDMKDWCAVVNVDKDKVKSVKLSANRPDNVIVVGEVFRHYLLSHILEFCSQSNIIIDKVPAKTSVTKELSLKGTMVSKHMSYIKDLVQRLNNKSRPSSDCLKEKAVFDNIKDTMVGFTLDVDFPMAKCADENKPPVYNVIRFYKIFDTPMISEKNTPTHSAKSDAKNDKAVTKRRTTFTTDTFDEKCMFDSQNTTSAQKSDVNSPKPDENIPESNLKVDGDCICCLQDFEMKDVEDEGKDVEYIFLEKETVESEDIGPIDSLNIENMKNDHLNEEQDKISMTIENLDEEKDKTSKTVESFDRRKTKTSMIVETLDEEKDKTSMTIEHLDEEKYKTTMTIENLDEEKYKKTMTIENLDEEKDKTSIIVENLNEGKKLLPIDILDEEKDKTSMIVENLDEHIQNLSINDKIDVQKNPGIGLSEDIRLFLEKNTQIQNSNYQDSNKDFCKRPISNSSTPDRVYKKSRFEKYSKKIIITPSYYPESVITNEIATFIQKSILQSIDYTDDLPLLECHGIQDGGLAYSCHSEKSLNFVTNLMKSLNFQVTLLKEESKCHKMTVKIMSFVKESVDTIFDRLETYNMSLDTKNWKVFDIERSRDSLVISMKVDEDSFKFIYKQNFTLYTGIDQAKFSILWD